MLGGKHGANMAVGLWKEKNGWANQDSVRVRYPDGNEMDISASDYEARCYSPPISDLP
jgi:hypothetical protein